VSFPSQDGLGFLGLVMESNLKGRGGIGTGENCRRCDGSTASLVNRISGGDTMVLGGGS
jgi:hypothetical protein